MNDKMMSSEDDDSFDAEYDALLNRSGYIALKDWSVVTLAGTDRQSFLHNMCTNEINKLTVGEGCEAFCTDVKGKILAHLWVLLLENRTTLLSVPNQAEQIVSHLDRYIIREDVQLADQSRVEAWTLLAGAGKVGLLSLSQRGARLSAEPRSVRCWPILPKSIAPVLWPCALNTAPIAPVKKCSCGTRSCPSSSSKTRSRARTTPIFAATPPVKTIG